LGTHGISAALAGLDNSLRNLTRGGVLKALAPGYHLLPLARLVDRFLQSVACRLLRNVSYSLTQ
jgi:hypothetical protein